MVGELYKRSVVAEPIVENIIPAVRVSTIWVDPADRQVETREQRNKRKRKKKEEKEAKKIARYDSLQDE